MDFAQATRPGDLAEAIWIAALGLIVNLVSAWLLGGDHNGHDHHGHGHDHNRAHALADNNLRSAYVHVLADALTSVLAIVALLAGQYLGWAWMDAATGIVGSIVIARWSWSLIRDTASVLVDATAGDEQFAEVREAMEDGDANVTDLHVWRVGPGQSAVVVSLVAADPLTPSDYARRLEVHEEYAHVTVEVHRCNGPHRLPRAA